MYAMYYEQEVVGGEEGTGGDEGDETGGKDGSAGGSSHIEY